MPRPTLPSKRSVPVIIAIVMWVALALDSPWHALGDGHSTAVALCLEIWGWSLWTAVTVAVLVPSAISLTVVRIIAPLAVIASIMATSPVAVFASVVIVVIAASPMFADLMVQGGAYGHEQRFCLRTPVPHMAPAVVAWGILVAPALAGTIGMAAQSWWWATPLTALAVVCVRFIPPRLHRLSRRWLVLVPAGVVLHDHLVLGETFMIMRSKIASMTLVDAPDDSADLTGGVMGKRLKIAMNEPDKVVLSDITAKTLGTTIALHVTTLACAPRRAEVALSALRP